MQIKQMRATMQQVLELLREVLKYDKIEENWAYVRKGLDWSGDAFYHTATTCAYLHLIAKSPKRWTRITREGLDLLKSSEKGNTATRDVLGSILLNLEFEFRIVESFKKLYERPDLYPGCLVSLSDIASELQRNGVRASQSVLQNLLKNFYQFAELVNVVGKKARLVSERYEELSRIPLYKKPHEISNTKFFNKLYEVYLLTRKKYGLDYVPIQNLRSTVCRSEDLRITEATFDKKLVSFPSSFSGKRIILAPPRSWREGGVFRGSDYYYYLAIFDKAKRSGNG